MLLKMKLKSALYSLLLLFILPACAQDTTVFITKSLQESEEPKGFFTQYSFAIPLKIYSERGQPDQFKQQNDYWYIPDGLSVHAGAGLHLKKWIAISANTGLDWRIEQKLVSAPVYGSIIVNPHFNKETSLFLQAGLGHAFALGRGALSGTYQKYRVGILFDDLIVFADTSFFGYPLKNVGETGNVTIGISIINFE
jgi:hypothetical protein